MYACYMWPGEESSQLPEDLGMSSAGSDSIEGTNCLPQRLLRLWQRWATGRTGHSIARRLSFLERFFKLTQQLLVRRL